MIQRSSRITVGKWTSRVKTKVTVHPKWFGTVFKVYIPAMSDDDNYIRSSHLNDSHLLLLIIIIILLAFATHLRVLASSFLKFRDNTQ